MTKLPTSTSVLAPILNTVEARGEDENKLICFCADHGDHLGDHNAWQKESFFDVACRVPLLMSWPAQLPANHRCGDLACLTDVFGIATGAAGALEIREGCDILGIARGRAESRKYTFGYYGEPGPSQFKVMVRYRQWKYIYMTNGGREQLFDVEADPSEVQQLLERCPDEARYLRQAAVLAFDNPRG